MNHQAKSCNNNEKIRKDLHKSRFLTTKTDQNHKTKLSYYVTTKIRNNKNLYGIIIEQHDIKFDSSDETSILKDSQNVLGVTYSQTEITRLIKALARQTVMPSTLLEVLDEQEIKLEEDVNINLTDDPEENFQAS